MAMPSHSVPRPAILSLAALGIVYGDIGTSPLYALKVAMQAAIAHAMTPQAAVLGIVSLILWSLVVVISLKYAILILRADNHGEGGVVAMLALLNARDAPPRSWRAALLVLGLAGAALLYGDGAITPAISVLSAIEGLKVDAPHLAPLVLPVTILILVILFLAQSRGTGFIGRIFGPVMLLWFLAIALLGIGGIVRAPRIMAALNPVEAIAFVLHGPPGVGLAILGAVFLAVTGGEAMYADMGHFGRTPIRLAWFAVVLPALILCYLGQGALLLHDPSAADNPFYMLAPGWAHYPLVAFATVATVIASQAIISGVFSLTRQSMQLGFLPRLTVRQTASEERGQIYVPLANWLLAGATLAAALIFRSSDALAGAYGVAVSGLMVISTFLATLVALQWGFSLPLVIVVNGLFLLIDLIFFSANTMKLREGGWFPLLIAGIVAFLMLTWRRGVHLVEAKRGGLRQAEPDFMAGIAADAPYRLPGIAAFLGASTVGMPLTLTNHLRHNRVLPARILLVSVMTCEEPYVADAERGDVIGLDHGFQRIVLRYGFMESLDIPRGLHCVAGKARLSDEELASLTYYIGRETITASSRIEGMAPWRESLFVAMQRNTAPSGTSFGIPAPQVVELGMEIEI